MRIDKNDCDKSILNSDIIQQLLKYSLPSPSQVEHLQRIKKGGSELSKPEKFIAIIGEIDKVVPRLKSFNLKLCLDRIARDINSWRNWETKKNWTNRRSCISSSIQSRPNIQNCWASVTIYHTQLVVSVCFEKIQNDVDLLRDFKHDQVP